jgi:hypothetical protein
VKFRVELVWKDTEDSAGSSIFLPMEGDMISVDRNLIRAIKDML